MDERAAGPQPRHRTYDLIGRGYATKRRPDPRIQSAINEALGDAKTVLNVGAGTGSYEPIDRAVVAIDPSVAMLAQRPRSEQRAARAVAENLPFRRHAFD